MNKKDSTEPACRVSANDKWGLLLIFGFILNLCTGCGSIRDLTEGTYYLTPIPQATLFAFPDEQSIKTKLQAVIAAQRGIDASHVNWVAQPK